MQYYFQTQNFKCKIAPLPYFPHIHISKIKLNFYKNQKYKRARLTAQADLFFFVFCVARMRHTQAIKLSSLDRRRRRRRKIDIFC